MGSFAAEYYIRQCVDKLRQGSGSSIIGGIEDSEKLYLRRKFAEVVIFEQEGYPLESPHSTPKVLALVECLQEMDYAAFSGLIFVRTRAEVTVLSHILSMQVPWLKVATFVGESGFSGRLNTLGDLAELRSQTRTLDDLRLGRKSLIVTTNALKKGY